MCDDAVAAEVLVAMCYAAAHSNRAESLLRPFPPEFVADGAKDEAGVKRALQTLPRLTAAQPARGALTAAQRRLLQWLLRPPGMNVAALSVVRLW